MEKRYLSFMLRIWQSNGEDPAAWRASLENPHTRQVVVFPSLELLYRYLQSQAVAKGGFSEISLKDGAEAKNKAEG